jgi:hypothetical protein
MARGMKNKEAEGLVNFFSFLPEAIEQNTKEHPEDLHLFRDFCVLGTAPGLSNPQLRMMLGDTLAMVGYFLEQYSDRVDVKGIDAFLASKGAPKLTSLLMSSKKRVRTIIKTGKIKNDEDYYLLKEVLSDVESTLLTERDCFKAESILSAWEKGEAC